MTQAAPLSWPACAKADPPLHPQNQIQPFRAGDRARHPVRAGGGDRRQDRAGFESRTVAHRRAARRGATGVLARPAGRIDGGIVQSCRAACRSPSTPPGAPVAATGFPPAGSRLKETTRTPSGGAGTRNRNDSIDQGVEIWGQLCRQGIAGDFFKFDTIPKVTQKIKCL